MFRTYDIKKSINCFLVKEDSLCYNQKGKLIMNNLDLKTSTSICGCFFEDYFTYSNNINYTNNVIRLEDKRVFDLGKISLQFQLKDSMFLCLENEIVGGT